MIDNLVFEVRRLEDQLACDEHPPDPGQPAKRRASRFASAKDRDEFVAARISLQQFAATLLNVEPQQLVANYHCPQCGQGQDHGRPGFLLDGGPAPIALSASRASGWVLLAGVAHAPEELRLGVDLESTGKATFEGFDDVALTATEKSFLSTIPDQERDSQRARLWARKEAWLKMTGEGLRRNPAELDVLERRGVQDLDIVGGRALPDGLVAALAIG
ncbi:4'-phosphopantetheinyl transferase superfamily protein [Paenarthrobacter sp. UW852]|uniref:4'-phosphopantetheinyl transferase family protein n=1 Tax=Paenarthrobacter sp. UW852 TaxID=2951989 RepID=UPI0021478296|nr:4'-phosphopantetheinyl transferase superfamily protein [Paenarthrobacter sp. UW852]MCR1163317.1 4'-phosphopantetheinyl transferase superfamily protein [Paenarthrobacter sp. UW852]